MAEALFGDVYAPEARSSVTADVRLAAGIGVPRFVNYPSLGGGGITCVCQKEKTVRGRKKHQDFGSMFLMWKF